MFLHVPKCSDRGTMCSDHSIPVKVECACAWGFVSQVKCSLMLELIMQEILLMQ